MGDRFDPYHVWLGIPPRDQPPNLYRLLGVELFESAPSVIASAADRLMAHLQSAATGEHASLVPPLLNQIATARACLLNPQQKAVYDAQLREQIATFARTLSGAGQRAAARPIPMRRGTDQRAAPASPPPRSSIEAAQPRAAPRPADSEVDAPSVLSQIRLALLSLAQWAFAAALIIGLTILAVVFYPKIRDEVAALTTADDRTAPAPRVPVAPRPAPVPAEPEDSNEQLGPDTATHEPQDPPWFEVVPPQDDPVAMPSDPRAEGPLAEAFRTELDPTPEADPQGKPKLAQPDPEAVRSAQRQLRERIQIIDNPANAEQLASLVRTLESASRNVVTDPVENYVIFITIRDLAADYGETEAADRMVRHIAGLFEIDSLAMRTEFMQRALKSAKVSPEARRKVQHSALGLIDELAFQGRFELSQPLLTEVRRYTPTLRDQTASYNLAQAILRHAQANDKHRAVEKAMETLETEPENGAAHLVLGKYHCFHCSQWETGLTHLVRSDDPRLSAAATSDVANPTDPQLQIEIADTWMQIAAQEHALVRRNIGQRARYWYERALTQLSDADREAVEQRIEALSADVGIQREEILRSTSVVLLPWADYFRFYDHLFPSHENKGVAGAATASSTWANRRPPASVLTTDRGSNWALATSKGFLRATWANGPVAQYILLFNGGHIPWGTARCVVNDSTTIPLSSVGSVTVVIIRLPQPTALKSVVVHLEGAGNPGISGLEIY